MRILQILALSVYFFLSAAEIVAAARRDTAKEKRVKPWLMPLLLIFYIAGVRSGEGRGFEPLLAAGLLSGFLGDTILLFPGGFVAGLFFFLLGHVMYIPLFLSGSWATGAPGLPVFAAVLVLFALGAGGRLLPLVPRNLKAPVALYMAVILLMTGAAYVRLAASFTLSSALCFAGALLFLVSDTLLSFTLFGGRGPGGVMETYLAAQLFITLSFL